MPSKMTSRDAQSPSSPNLSQINPKDLDNVLTADNCFVWSGYVPPGKHCIVIRDDRFVDQYEEGKPQFSFRDVLIEPRTSDVLSLH